MGQSSGQLLFLVHYRPPANTPVFVHKLVCAWLVILLRDAANQHRFGIGIGPRVISGGKLVNHWLQRLGAVLAG
jgi:hypothetical protein